MEPTTEAIIVPRASAAQSALGPNRSPDPLVATWQRRFEPVQKRLADGSHLTGAATKLVSAAGFEMERVESRAATGPKPWAWLTEGAAIEPR